MAEHFKLEITNRSTKITTWTGGGFSTVFNASLMGAGI